MSVLNVLIPINQALPSIVMFISGQPLASTPAAIQKVAAGLLPLVKQYVTDLNGRELQEVIEEMLTRIRDQWQMC